MTKEEKAKVQYALDLIFDIRDDAKREDYLSENFSYCLDKLRYVLLQLKLNIS